MQIIAPPPEKLPFRPLLPTAGRLSPAILIFFNFILLVFFSVPGFAPK